MKQYDAPLMEVCEISESDVVRCSLDKDLVGRDAYIFDF